LSTTQKKLPFKAQLTTLVYQLFGGYLVSQITCQDCNNKSKNFDPFLDVALEIGKDTKDVIGSFRKFTKKEVLEGSNAYFCENCDGKRRAVKQFQIQELPKYLICQVKRFTHLGHKINDNFKFSDQLDVSEFVSDETEGSRKYNLYGVICHLGHSMRSGHYVAYIRNPASKFWYKYDDSHVTTVSEEFVFSQKAYLLCYEQVLPGKKRRESCPKIVCDSTRAHKDSTKKRKPIEFEDIRGRAPTPSDSQTTQSTAPSSGTDEEPTDLIREEEGTSVGNLDYSSQWGSKRKVSKWSDDECLEVCPDLQERLQPYPRSRDMIDKEYDQPKIKHKPRNKRTGFY
jgi:hypothetical protein